MVRCQFMMIVVRDFPVTQTTLLWQKSMELCALNKRLTVFKIAETVKFRLVYVVWVTDRKTCDATKFVPLLMSRDQKVSHAHRPSGTVVPCKPRWHVYETNYYEWLHTRPMVMKLRKKSNYHSGLVNFHWDQQKLVKSNWIRHADGGFWHSRGVICRKLLPGG